MQLDELTPAVVAAHLTTARLGRECLVLPETDSTSTALRRDFRDRPDGFALLAERQTAGRGRLGRTFVSSAGDGLYFSFLLRPVLPLTALELLTFTAAVAVCEAVERLCGLHPTIKWVNDVFLGPRKLCGILVESAVSAPTGYPDFVIVGIGVNLHFDRTAHPELSDVVAALSDAVETPPTRAVLAASILNAFEPRCDALCAGQTAELLAAYRSRLNCLGRPVTVHTPAAVYEAFCEDLTEQGGLLVRTADGERRTLRAGEISIRL